VAAASARDIVGRATSADTIELLYHCITTEGELLASRSSGHASAGAAGRIELNFQWSWLTCNRSGGRSPYSELC
jgi:hypothetical protein